MTRHLRSYKFDPTSQGYILEVEEVPGIVGRILGQKVKAHYYVGFGEVWHQFPSFIRCERKLELVLADMHKQVEWELKEVPIIMSPGEDEKAVRENIGDFKWKQYLQAGEASDFYGIPMGELTREALLVVISLMGTGAMSGKINLPKTNKDA